MMKVDTWKTESPKAIRCIWKGQKPVNREPGPNDYFHKLTKDVEGK